MSPVMTSRFQALMAALLWGASFVATKAVLAEVQPITLIVIRFAMGVIVLGLAVWRTRQFKWVGWKDMGLIAILGAISIAIHQGLQATGLVFTSASNMAWLVALNPVFTALLAWLFLAETMGPLRIVGLAIAFAGAVVVVTKGVLTPDSFRVPGTTGDLLALASALNWSIFSVASKPLLKRFPATMMMAYVMFSGWVLTLPFFFLGQNWTDIPRLTATGWTSLVFLGVFCSGLAYIFWYEALARIEAAQVAAFIYIEPLVTVVVAAIVLSETFTLATLFGGFAILAGVYLVNRPSLRVQRQRVEAQVAED